MTEVFNTSILCFKMAMISTLSSIGGGIAINFSGNRYFSIS